MAKKGKYSYSKKTKKTYKKQKGVNSMLPHDKAKAEKKFFDIALSGAIGLTAGVNHLCNPIGQALTASGRIGNRIELKSVQYKCQLFSNTTGIPSDTSVRLMLVYDKECDGTLPPVTGVSNTTAILDNTIGNLGTALPLNINQKDRYVVLSDKLVSMKHNGTATAPIKLNFTVEKWKGLNTHTQYNDGTSGIATINTGAIYFMAISDVQIGFNNEPSHITSVRLRYTDQ